MEILVPTLERLPRTGEIWKPRWKNVSLGDTLGWLVLEEPVFVEATKDIWSCWTLNFDKTKKSRWLFSLSSYGKIRLSKDDPEWGFEVYSP